MSARTTPPALALALMLTGCAEGTTVDEPAATTDAGGTDPCGTQDPDLSSRGASCEVPISLGTLSDAAGDAQIVTGNAIAGVDAWYSFAASDDIDTMGDEFHVDVHFLENPQDGYQIDVFRGGCTAATQLADGETDRFDWYTDFPFTSEGCTTEGPCGEGDCVPEPGEEGRNNCGDDSATFNVKVSRVDGGTSCSRYELELSNGYYEAN